MGFPGSCQSVRLSHSILSIFVVVRDSEEACLGVAGANTSFPEVVYCRDATSYISKGWPRSSDRRRKDC